MCVRTVHSEWLNLTIATTKLRGVLLVVPVQILFSPLAILLSFISRFGLVRLRIDSNTTGSHKKIGRVLRSEFLELHQEDWFAHQTEIERKQILWTF